MTQHYQLLLIAMAERRRHIRIRGADRLRFAPRATERADLGQPDQVRDRAAIAADR
ncbi:hypothetical protein [Streptomyces sp. NBC_00385]|uniref:hypothetical protein n=1 Tax=Streptomyces sp. NBC_00385 TaxID=2975733 RepID=UPI002DD80F24|nr:hypothetical protein [Streptomyces sp. NBC_00385]WRZ06072.1 hypothetical protein OG959_23400 [Streptomyces sp. NBC_00385]